MLARLDGHGLGHEVRCYWQCLPGRLVVGILMQVAEWERGVISERIKAALGRVKARGVKLGKPSTLPISTRRLIARLRARPMTWQQVADRLNGQAVSTPSGRGKWGVTLARRHHPDQRR